MVFMNEFLVFICFLDTGGNYTGEEFFDPRETPFVPINPPTPSNRQGRFKHQVCGGASNAARPPASSENSSLHAKEKISQVEVTEGLTLDLRV